MSQNLRLNLLLPTAPPGKVKDNADNYPQRNEITHPDDNIYQHLDSSGADAVSGVGAGAGAGVGALAQATVPSNNITRITPIIILFIKYLPPMLIPYTITFKQQKG